MKIRIGGVPEHFNYPWHYGIANRIFTKHDLDLEWIDVKGGSGAMCKMLENNQLDAALVLTEGIVQHIHNGGKARIIRQFVKSPLLWGVHTRPGFNLKENYENARFARSRVGSGSHIMAYVFAEQRNFNLREEQFVTVGNIDGALQAFDHNEADVLLWERFMTQPYVDQKLVERADECVSPWPCFVLVGSQSFIENNKESLLHLNNALTICNETIMQRGDTKTAIANMFHLKQEQVEQWYTTVEWQTSDWISSKMLKNVSETLKRVNVLEQVLPPEKLCYKGAKLY
jgi:sulfonate transport system substrate-binding protein